MNRQKLNNSITNKPVISQSKYFKPFITEFTLVYLPYFTVYIFMYSTNFGDTWLIISPFNFLHITCVYIFFIRLTYIFVSSTGWWWAPCWLSRWRTLWQWSWRKQAASIETAKKVRRHHLKNKKKYPLLIYLKDSINSFVWLSLFCHYN